MQKLLLLPELCGTAITGVNSDPVKTTSGSCSPNVMPTLELAEEYSGHETLPNSKAPSIIVNSLIASWTHVRSDNFMTL